VLAFLQYEISTHYLRFNQTDRELALLTRSAESARLAGDLNLVAASECAAAFALGHRDPAAAAARLAAGEAAFAKLAAPAFETRTDCLRGRARVLEAEGRVPEAIAALEAGIAALPDPGPDAWTNRGVVRTHLTDLYRRVERFGDAMKLSEENLAEIRRHGQSGTLNEFGALNNVAGNLARLGEARAADAIYRELLTWFDRGVFPVTPLAVQSNIGFSALRMGDAAAALRLADAEHAADLGAGNPLQAALADLLAARALLALGRLDEAETRLHTAETFWQTNPKAYARMLVEGGLVGAELRAARGDLSGAVEAVTAIVHSLGYPDRTNAPGLDRALRLSARLRLRTGAPAIAAQHAAAALDLAARTARDPRASADVGEAALLRAQAHQALGRANEARADAALAREALGSGLGPDHPLSADAAVMVAAVEATSSAARR
jgi:tetratricopeptide (TPR) repeat protein